ncbi:hypothetical protein [Grimontia marina]|uniref:Lipoprotein n=1 Tax=Grimontia marina TaxID=646534 RepID=A0A128F2X4_9GAMM|nr:hypothetical protein [Grimontia marina]CZF80780.1 hypothetical protein GMA8713_01594 [Grimontia marina]
MKSYLFGVSITLLLAGCGGGGGDGNTVSQRANSSACFNESLYNVGTVVNEVNTVIFNGASPSENSETTEVTQTTSYRGYSDAIEEKITDGSGEDNRLYILADSTEKSVTTLGQILGSDEIIYRPSGFVLNYDLALGEKKTFPTVSEYENNVLSNTTDYSLEYLRTENITVPAGTFETCVLEFVLDNVDSSGDKLKVVFTQYIGVGNGITIREDFVSTDENGETTTGSEKLVSATINGNPI